LQNLIEVGWAAGFYDGEGHSRYAKTSLSVSITQNSRYELDRFRRAMGVGTVGGPYKNGQSPKLVFRFYAHGKNAEHIMELLRPYLCPTKIAQWDAAIIERDTRRNRKLIDDVYDLVGPVDVLISHES
jgi:hypothetical protein